jgi:hypothetical protein
MKRYTYALVNAAVAGDDAAIDELLTEARTMAATVTTPATTAVAAAEEPRAESLALHMACKAGHARVDPSVKHIEFDSTTETPVHAALRLANETIALMIIEHPRALMTENADTVVDSATCVTPRPKTNVRILHSNSITHVGPHPPRRGTNSYPTT